MSEDRYQIQGKIGQGGLGAVYKAFDTHLKRQVALKRVLTPEEGDAKQVEDAADQLMKEATVLSSLNHPNIVSIFDIGQDESGGFVVMELLDGETLDETVARGLLTLEDFHEVVNQSLEALIAAQAVNLLHRDLKPGNIMVIWRPSGKFQIKILDFGLAKISESPSLQTIDHGDAILGSIYFMAPEQFERRKLDFRTDMYSIGCIFYYCLTGKYPFDGESAPQVMASHLQHKVKPLRDVRPDLPVEVCQWVMWLVNRDMAKRPADARDALDRYPQNGSSGSAPVYVSSTPEESQPATAGGRKLKVGVPPQTSTAKAKAASGTGRQAGKVKSKRVSTAGQRSASRRVPTASGRAAAASRASSAVRLPTEAHGKRKTDMRIVYGAIVSGSILLLVAVFLLFGKINRSKAIDRLYDFEEGSIASAKDVKMMVDFMEDPNHRETAANALVAVDGQEVPGAIIESLKKAESTTRKRVLLEVVALRDQPEAFNEVVNIFKSTADERVRVAASQALRRIALAEHQEALLDLLGVSGVSGSLRSSLERTAVSVTLRIPDVEARAEPILARMENSAGEERKSLCRVLGAAGGRKALTRLQTIFGRDGEDDYKYDAMLALQNWRDRTCKDLVLSLMEEEGNQALNIGALRAYIQLIGLPHPSVTSEQGDLDNYRRAFEAAQSGNDKQRVLYIAQSRPLPSSVTFLESVELPGMEKVIEKVIAELKKTMENAPLLSGPQATLPAGQGVLGGDIEAAYLDDQTGVITRWSSPNSWIQWSFQIDAPGTYDVEVVLACEENPGTVIEIISGEADRVQIETRTTGGADDFKPLKASGSIEFKKAGPQMLFLYPGEVVQPRIGHIKAVKLTKKG